MKDCCCDKEKKINIDEVLKNLNRNEILKEEVCLKKEENMEPKKKEEAIIQEDAKVKKEEVIIQEDAEAKKDSEIKYFWIRTL